MIGDYLAQADLDLTDVTEAILPDDAMAAALEQSEIAGAYLNSPVPAAVKEVATRVAYSEVINAGVIAGPKRLDGDPLVVDGFLRAIARTVNTYLQGDYHSDSDVVAALVEATGAPESAFAPGRVLDWSPTLVLPPPDTLERLQRYLMQP